MTVIVRQRLVGGRGPMQDTEELPALKWEVTGDEPAHETETS